MLIASAPGLQTSPELYARRPLFFTANVFSYRANSVSSDGGSADSNRSNDEPPRVAGTGRKDSGSRNKFKKKEKS
jgi:hypothetical protein